MKPKEQAAQAIKGLENHYRALKYTETGFHCISGTCFPVPVISKLNTEEQAEE